MKFLLTMAALLTLLSNSAIAQEESMQPVGQRNTDAIENYQAVSNEDDCEGEWEVLWPLAKKGDLKARAAILFDMYAKFRELPGRS